MKFLTDISTEVSNYCLLNIKHYYDPRKDSKKLVFIDPSVMELRTQTEYSHIDLIHQLLDNHELKSNEFISVDYPCDMIDRTLPKDEYETLCQMFIQKSIANNWKYANNLQYICAIQYDWMALDDFYFRMKELEPIYNGKKKIVALGNLCRLLVDRKHMNHDSAEYKYFKKVMEYIIQNKEKFYWIHIYGMSLYAIKSFMPLLEFACPNIIFSVDSTKWTRVCNKKLHAKYVKPKGQTQLFESAHTKGAGCTKETRNEFFLEYISEIRKKGIKVDY